MESFEARAVAAQELTDANTFAVVLAEHPDGTGQRLELQLSLTFDDSDRRLGQDTYCICTESGATHYGGVTGWNLNELMLEITLDEAAARELGVNRGFRVALKPEVTVGIQLREGVTRVLGSMDAFLPSGNPGTQ